MKARALTFSDSTDRGASGMSHIHASASSSSLFSLALSIVSPGEMRNEEQNKS